MSGRTLQRKSKTLISFIDFQLTVISLVRDAEYFKARISKIDEAGDIGDFLLKIAEEKTVVATAILPAINGTNPTNVGAK